MCLKFVFIFIYCYNNKLFNKKKIIKIKYFADKELL